MYKREGCVARGREIAGTVPVAGKTDSPAALRRQAESASRASGFVRLMIIILHRYIININIHGYQNKIVNIHDLYLSSQVLNSGVKIDSSCQQ